MMVSLYTSRVVLDILGVNDYGIYNVIGGIVVLVSMINHSMAAATQRFITYALGKHDLKKVSDTFSMSMTAHICICFLIVVMGESVGLYYVANYLNVAPERHEAALWVYQISLATIVLNIIRIPYNASVVAYEKMSFFAIVSIIETILKLLVVYLLVIGSIDKLILYSILILISTIICNFIYKVYCHRHFSTCRYYWIMDSSYFKKLLGFFGWNLMGTIATTGTRQMGNVIVNYYCGPIANAAYGVASQVNVAIGGLANNFQTAFTPQIVKLYSQGKMKELYILMNRSALLSYYLLFLVAMPIFLYIDFVLGIWLKEVPQYASIFCRWLIIYAFIDSLQSPLWKAITATGNIRIYEIWLNLVLILNIPFSYYCLKEGMLPYVVVMISTLLNLLSAVIRTIHVKFQIQFPVGEYIREVLFHASLVTIGYIIFGIGVKRCIKIEGLFDFVVFFVASVFIIGILIYLFGINRNDRVTILNVIKAQYNHYIKQI